MRKHLFPILFFCLLILGGYYAVCNTTWFSSFLVRQIFTRYLTALELKSFRVEQQRLTFPDTVTLRKVQMVLGCQGKNIRLEFDAVTLPGILTFFKERRQIRMSIRGLNADSDSGALKGFDAKLLLSLENNSFSKIDGVLRGAGGRFQSYALENLFARVKADRQQLEVLEVSADFYGGHIQQGQFSLTYSPVINYIFWMEFAGVKPEQLQQAYHPVLSEITGDLQGSFRLVGDVDSVNVLAIILAMPEPGTISPSLMTQINERVSSSDLKQQLESITQALGRFPVDKATLDIQNLDNNKVALILNLNNNEHQINLQEMIRMDIPEGLKNYLLQKH